MDRIRENYMIPIFDDLLRHETFERVTDIGCGNGLFTSYFKERSSCYLVGVDGSPYGLAQAAERGFDETILMEDLCANVLPLKDNGSDLVVCKDVLEHLLDPMAVMLETARILTSGGLLLLHVPNHFPLYYRLKFVFYNKLDIQKYFPQSNEWNLPHIRFFTMSGLKRMVRLAGFEVARDYSSHFAFVVPLFSDLPGGRFVARRLAIWSPSNFAVGFTLLCRKLE